ncbi:rab GTPase-activating protein 1-like isoform X1 [Tachysurus ichikawai]
MICASDLCDFCLDDCGMVGGARQDSPQEGVITRDIHRTFPAHDYFKDSDGDGQDSLYKICKAYSVYDEEIGYCQGQSFLAAVLLLHMPEEQAFCVLVKIMYDYKLRNLYRNNFEDLHCKFYQLERLIQEQLPDLWTHFQDLNLEAHMYASQWFLTLFTAKFPLCMVFHITDLLLCEGLNIIFNVALALLKTSKEDLLQADFEGALKFFRVQLPKRYRAAENARRLMEQACNIKVRPVSPQSFLTHCYCCALRNTELSLNTHMEAMGLEYSSTFIRTSLPASFSRGKAVQKIMTEESDSSKLPR